MPLENADVHEAGWYSEHDVDLRLGTTVVRIDRSAHEIELADGSRIGYDRLLLTTGASVRRLDVPGAELDGVHYLRSAAESESLRSVLSTGDRRAVVIGAGWIGLETAAAAREYGNQVHIVEPEETPLARSVGPELGSVFAGLHRRHGVELVLGDAVNELRGRDGRVTEVLTSAGVELPADVVIVGMGVTPNVGLAADAGIDVDNGIVVDEALRSSDPDIFAAGDVANAYSPLLGRRIRVEHWANALNGGPAAARSMLGQDVVYDSLPYFFSDQYELGMEATGYWGPGEYDLVVYRGDVAELEFIAFWLSGGRVVGGMNVNVWDVTDDIHALIRAGKQIDRTWLIDPSVPLVELG